MSQKNNMFDFSEFGETIYLNSGDTWIEPSAANQSQSSCASCNNCC